MTHPFDFHGVLHRVERNGELRVVAKPERPSTLPCPDTGRALKIAAIDANATALCPSCMRTGYGAFVSFVSDLRLAYACPQCEQMVWVAGA